MKFLLVIVIAVVVSVAVSSEEAPPCRTNEERHVACLKENNMTLEEDTRTSTNPSNFTAEDVKKQCLGIHKYFNVSLCMAREMDRCDKGGGSFNQEIVTEHLKQTDIICSDPKASFDCVAQLMRDINTKNICDIPTSPKQDNCEVAKARSACLVEVVRKCDDYTGGVFEQYASVSTAQTCKYEPSWKGGLP